MTPKYAPDARPILLTLNKADALLLPDPKRVNRLGWIREAIREKAEREQQPALPARTKKGK